MTRFVPVTMLVMVLAASRVAGAQGDPAPGTLPDGSTIKFDKLYLHEDGDPDFIEPKQAPNSLWNYFNMAHCQCAKAPPAGFVETTYGYLLTLVGPTSSDRALEIWVGSACDNNTDRDKTCKQITDQTIQPIASIAATNGVTRTIPLFTAMTPGAAETACVARQQDLTTWGISPNSGGTRDFFVSKVEHSDTQAPRLPTGFRAVGGDGAIQISWPALLDTSDTYAYQALCAVAETNEPVFASGHSEQRYMTAASLCGLDSIDLGMGTAISTPPSDPVPIPVSVADLPDGLKNLDPAFLCGDAFSPTATSLRIEGLKNKIAYKVVVLAVDKFQNPVGTFFTSTITPVATTDFWEDLHDPKRGSKVEGGLCLLAETYGDDSSLTSALRAFRDDTLGGPGAGRWLRDAYYATLGKLGVYVHGSIVRRVIAGIVLAPVVALGLLWHWLTLPGLLALVAIGWLWRRRRLAVPRWLLRVATPAGIALVALASGPAHAGGYQPYWENSNLDADPNQSFADDPGLVKWQVGIRVGPYIPDIDKQVGKTPGPYKQMFGGYYMLTALDVDRMLWSGFGQVGVGLSVGYFQKRARAFTLLSMPSDDPRPRGSDENKFRLIPMALTGTYRLTFLDDEYGIPIVPYARAGLSYYVWWASVSNGDFATVCKDGSNKDDNPTCSKNKALGASLGLQGSIGLSIRAERIDASTANSMRQSGIQHAGIYGELSLARVDGFGSDTKLSVGDRTWFAGVDFEF